MSRTCSFNIGLISVVLVLGAAGCDSQARKDLPTTKSPAVSETLNDVTSIGTLVVDSEARPKPDGVLPTFQTVGRESGLDFERYEDFRGQHRILEVNGGGVAIFDFDLDQQLDIYFTDGCRLPLSLGDRTHQGKLYRNDGFGRFKNQSIPSGLVRYGQSHGCAVGDFDNDGFDDLYVTGYGGNSLWHNCGDGTFADVTVSTGTHVGKWSSSAAFADLNNDSILDLYVANYLDESDEDPKLCPNSSSPDQYEQCSPAKFSGVDDVVFFGDGLGGFIDGTASAGLSQLKGKGLGVVIADFDGDFQPEIYVANDGQANFLFQAIDSTSIQSTTQSSDLRIPRYQERGLISNVALSESGFAQASMGVAAGDFDGNGLIDLFVTNFYADTNTLYANRGALMFEDLTRASRLASTNRQTLGWGTFFIDLDNDGWLDLFVANGHIDDRTWMKYPEPYKMRPLLYRNNGKGRFEDVATWAGSYFTTEWLGRGAAYGDLNRDGKLDIVVSHQLSESVALYNTTDTAQRSLSLKLVGKTGNRNGFSAVVETLDESPPQVRPLLSGDSFQSANAHEIQITMRSKQRISIKVRWSASFEEVYRDLTPGRWILTEGCTAVKAIDYHD